MSKPAAPSLQPERALVRVWLANRGYLERLCLRWARGSGPDAEDLLSDAVLRVLERGSLALADATSPRAWLTAVIANLGRDRNRERRRRKSLDVPFDVDEVQPAPLRSPRGLEDAVHARRELQRLLGPGDSLSSVERQILVGRCLGENYRDLAARLQVSEATARKLAQHGREQLRARARLPRQRRARHD